MIKDATGVDLVTAIGMEIKSRNVFDKYAPIEKKAPIILAKKSPTHIRIKVNNMDCQKEAIPSIPHRHLSVSTGDAKRIAESTYIDKNCHTKSQIMTAHIFIFFCFLLDVIEFICW